MKRKMLWLTLPLILCALIFAAKWRTEHPTPTEQDLRFQNFLSQSSSVNITHYRSQFGNYTAKVPAQDFKPFAKQFYLLSFPGRRDFINVGSRGLLVVHCSSFESGGTGSSSVTIKINLDDYHGRVSGLDIRRAPEQNLHPVTVKRWMELLLANPRIGPELRARLN